MTMLKSVSGVAFLALLFMFGQALAEKRADTKSPDLYVPYLYVIGVGQDAGLPQTGCYQPHCMPGWQDPSLRCGAVSLAFIDPQARKTYIFEATPDFPSQLYKLEVEAPSDQYDLDGIFLTLAHR